MESPTRTAPAPAKPKTRPEIKPQPFNPPQPKVDPTPKGYEVNKI